MTHCAPPVCHQCRTAVNIYTHNHTHTHTHTVFEKDRVTECKGVGELLISARGFEEVKMEICSLEVHNKIAKRER